MAESSFTQRPPVRPSSAASRSARTSGVRPGSRLTRSAGSWPTGSSAGVAPDVLRARLDLLAGDRLHELGVVVDLQRAEALGAGVLGDQAEGGPAVAAHQAAGGTGRDRATGVTSRPGRIRERSGSCDDYLLIFPAPGRRAVRDGIGTFRSHAMRADGGCRGFIGPCPSAPLDEWNAVDRTQAVTTHPAGPGAFRVTPPLAAARRAASTIGPHQEVARRGAGRGRAPTDAARGGRGGARVVVAGCSGSGRRGDDGALGPAARPRPPPPRSASPRSPTTRAPASPACSCSSGGTSPAGASRCG